MVAVCSCVLSAQFAADLSSMEGVNLVHRSLTSLHSVTALHVLVNNSGASWGEPLDKFSEKGWDRVFDLNVKSLFFLTRSLVPLLAAAASPSDPARVINIGSVTGFLHQSVPTWSYEASKVTAAAAPLTAASLADCTGLHLRSLPCSSASAVCALLLTLFKAAVHHLTKKLAEELSKQSITVNAIAPGYVPTKMSKTLPTSFTVIAAKLPLKRVGTAEDMAGCALFLSSRAGSWVTGHVLLADGGQLTISSL